MTVDLPEGVPKKHPVVLFDGVCNLCESSVQFLIKHDPEGLFRFAPLQSAVAETLLAEHEIDPTDLESVVLVEADEIFVKSDAVVRIADHLGGRYRLLSPFGVLPKRLRNASYDFVADRRYGWFGKKEQCMMPTPDIRSRFLAGGPGSNAAEN